MANTETYGPTRHMTNKRERKLKGQSRMENPETLATWSHKTQDEDKNTTHNIKKMSNTDPT